MILLWILLIFLILWLALPINKFLLRKKIERKLERDIPKYIDFKIKRISDFTSHYYLSIELKVSDNVYPNNNKYKGKSFNALIKTDPFHNILEDNTEFGVKYLIDDGIDKSVVKSYNRERRLEDLGIF